jgi:hypothetical protein
MDHDGNENPERLWACIKNLPSAWLGHKLTPGDVIKLGRVRVKVKELSCGSGKRVSHIPKDSNANS